MSARRAPLGKHLKMLERARCRFAVSSRIRDVRENRCGVLGAIQGRDAPKMGMPAVEMDVSLIFILKRFLICGEWAWKTSETAYRLRRPFWPFSRLIHSRIYAGQFSSRTP